MIQHHIIIHFVERILNRRIVHGIVLNVKHATIGENGIVKNVINVRFILSSKFNYVEFILGTYGVSLPCEGCGGSSSMAGFC